MQSRSFPLLLSSAALAGFFCIALTSAAQSTPSRTLLALSKHDHTLAIVDPDSLKVIARAPVGPSPHEVIASEDGKTAYVSIYAGSRYHTLSVIDLVAQKALADIDTGALTGPHGLASVGGKIWFTAEGAKVIGTVDPATSKIDWVMGTGQNRTHMLFVTPDQKHIYTTNVGSGTVTVLDKITLTNQGQPQTDWTETIISVGKGDEGFDVSPDGKELWTANGADGTLSVIDLAARKVVATLDSKTATANRLKFTPDGKLVLVSLLGGTDLVIYDAASRTLVKRLPIGHGAAGILMDPVANRAFIGCTADNYVAILDLKTLEITGHLDVGGEPDGLAWAIRP